MNEKDTTEHKLVSGDRLPKNLWESITGFSNANGGTISLGVDDAGMHIGVKPELQDKIQQDLLSESLSYNHKLYPEIKLHDDGVITAYFPPVPAALRPIYKSSKGIPIGAKIRVGSSNVGYDDEWARRFSIAASGGAEIMEYQQNHKKVFGENFIVGYLEKVKEKRGDVYAGFNQEAILKKLRAITESNKPTLFGLLAFAKDRFPQEIIAPTLNIAVTQYAGTEKVNTADPSQVRIDDREFDGNALVQFEEAFKFIKSKLPIKSDVDVGGKRRDYLVIPDIAIREIVANAIIHRDYSTISSRIQVDIYSDRIEFTNPGRSLVPIEELETAHPQTRNALLMNYMKDLEVSEQRARGIKTIKISLSNANLQEPLFENKGTNFKVTLFTSAFIKDEDQQWLGRFKEFALSDDQLKTLVHLKHNPKEGVDNSTYREINHMKNVGDDRVVKLKLRKLVALGILTKKGTRRYTKYYLVEALRLL